MDIQHESGESKGSFFLKIEGDVKANLTYSRFGGSGFIIDHTEVSDELRGQGVGKALVQQAVHYAREKELEIIPLCPFAKSVFEQDESLQDVLKK